MKWYLFSIGLFSFIIYRSTKSEINFHRTDKGIYKIDQKAVDGKTPLGQDNNSKLQSNEKYSSAMATDFYTVSNNSKLTINNRWLNDDHIAFLMNTRISSKKDFVNGNWVIGDHLYGGFYLAKPFLK